ncbi:MAG: hypothetical protein ACP5I3_12295 [Thermoproteus sp.]
MKFLFGAPPRKRVRTPSGKIEYVDRPLRELKHYVRPVEGWEALGVQFKTREEFYDWICSHIYELEPDRHKTYRRWVLFCYDRQRPKGWMDVKVYLRTTPDRPDVRQVFVENEKIPRSWQRIVDEVCRYIEEMFAVPYDERSASYFPYWIIYCRRRRQG